MAKPKFAELINHVAVLFGGDSAEREISLQSGAAVTSALTRRGYAPVAIDTADASWQQTLQSKAFKFVFIALHGPGGEDGSMQGYLQTQKLNYSGSGVLASALGMDKMRTKQLWRGIGVSTAPFAVLTEHSDWNQVCAEIGDVLMVKPALEGSSIGMSKAKGPDELAKAFALARTHGDIVIAERFITGAEYTVAMLGNEILPPIKLETQAEFYDFHAKYIANDTRYLCPCGLSEGDECELKNLAQQAFRSVGCRGWARADVMRDQDGKFYVLEVNTVPGMTSHSLVPMAAKAAGYEFDDLVEAIIAASVVDV